MEIYTSTACMTAFFKFWVTSIVDVFIYFVSNRAYFRTYIVVVFIAVVVTILCIFATSSAKGKETKNIYFYYTGHLVSANVVIKKSGH